jgi:protein gp37
MKNTAIEWCDHTFNPWEGCTKVSPGCAHCYAETRNARFGGGTAPNWGKGAPRRRTSVQNWNQVRKWNREAGKLPPFDGDQVREWHRPRVFCASLADVFDEEVPIQWRADLFQLISEANNLDFLLLTKRPENVLPMLFQISNTFNPEATGPQYGAISKWVRSWLDGKPPANVWIGTTVEDQQRADERIPELLQIPARVRFLSCEPLLGPVDISQNFYLTGQARRRDKTLTAPGSRSKIDWVICGGESGPGARPMHPQWATSLRDQCAAAGVPFLFKQWGEWLPDYQRGFTTSGDITWGLVHESGSFREVLFKGTRHWSQDTTWKPGETGTTNVGKKAAGRLLDGIEHSEFPA